MRLAEKTIELNFCAQLGQKLGERILWFGLTQKQEARAGYDAYAQMGGRLVALQFKASDHVMLNRKRRFHAQHHQLVALRRLGQRRPRSVFYVFPSLGNTRDLSLNSDLVAQCQVLDAGTIPVSVSTPTCKSGKPRKSGRHYVDVEPGRATIHSEPTTVALESVRAVLEAPEHPAGGLLEADRQKRELNVDDERGWFDRLLSSVSGSAMGAVILPPAV